MNERAHIAAAALGLGDDLVQAVAFAIWQAWSRERDPYRAEKRFERLKPAIREQFEDEAKAAIRVVENFNG